MVEISVMPGGNFETSRKYAKFVLNAHRCREIGKSAISGTAQEKAKLRRPLRLSLSNVLQSHKRFVTY